MCVQCGVWCVVCLLVCVCRGDVCISSCLAPKRLPCVRSKRSRVYLQNARVTKDTGVLNVHTRTFSTYTRERLSLFSSRVSLLSCLPLSSSRVSSLCFSSLSVTMTMITRPVGSLCSHKALTCQSVKVHGPWPIPCWPNMCASCKKHLSLCFLCTCVCICLCLFVFVFVFGCVWLCEHVLVCCLHCVVGWRRCVGCCVVVTVKKRKTRSVISKSPPREFIPITVSINSKILKPHQITNFTV